MTCSDASLLRDTDQELNRSLPSSGVVLVPATCPPDEQPNIDDARVVNCALSRRHILKSTPAIGAQPPARNSRRGGSRRFASRCAKTHVDVVGPTSKKTPNEVLHPGHTKVRRAGANSIENWRVPEIAVAQLHPQNFRMMPPTTWCRRPSCNADSSVLSWHRSTSPSFMRPSLLIVAAMLETALTAFSGGVPANKSSRWRSAPPPRLVDFHNFHPFYACWASTSRPKHLQYLSHV